MTIKISLCKIEQLNLLRDVSIETYRDTFEEHNCEALMQQYFSDALNIERLRKEFQTQGSYFYFIYLNDEVAGFLKLNVDDAQSDDVDKSSLEIERLYIRKSHLRQGLGKVLIQFAFEKAKELNKPSAWLGVWENNLRALTFYKQLGFYQIGDHPFDMGGDIQTDLLMKKDL